MACHFTRNCQYVLGTKKSQILRNECDVTKFKLALCFSHLVNIKPYQKYIKNTQNAVFNIFPTKFGALPILQECPGKAWDLSTEEQPLHASILFRTEHLSCGPVNGKFFNSYYLKSFTSKIPLSSLRNISKNEEDDFDQRERETVSLNSSRSVLWSTQSGTLYKHLAPGSLPTWKQTKRK